MTFNIGFEFEFGSKVNEFELTRQFSKRHLLAPYNRHAYQNWTLHQDGSGYPKAECAFQAEIVTPVLPIETGLIELAETLDWMTSIGAMTCRNSGLHVNLSFKDKALNKKIRPLSLLFRLDENGLLVQYNRYKASSYVQSITDILKQNWVNKGQTTQNRRRHANDGIRSCYSHGFYSMEFGKLFGPWSDANPYLEFRITGGVDYPKRLKEIQKTIGQYQEAMEFSLIENDKFVDDKLEQLVA